MVALVMVAYEVVARRSCTRGVRRPAGRPGAEAPPPSGSELNRWVTVVDRLIRSPE